MELVSQVDEKLEYQTEQLNNSSSLLKRLTQLEEDVHRSTPPITGSIDATAVIKSATMPPSHIAALRHILPS